MSKALGVHAALLTGDNASLVAGIYSVLQTTGRYTTKAANNKDTYQPTAQADMCLCF